MTFLELIAQAIETARAEMPGLPVGWQWLANDTWHTVDKSQVNDPEAYAKAFGLPVRAIYAGPVLQMQMMSITQGVVPVLKVDQ